MSKLVILLRGKVFFTKKNVFPPGGIRVSVSTQFIQDIDWGGNSSRKEAKEGNLRSGRNQGVAFGQSDEFGLILESGKMWIPSLYW